MYMNMEGEEREGSKGKGGKSAVRRTIHRAISSQK